MSQRRTVVRFRPGDTHGPCHDRLEPGDDRVPVFPVQANRTPESPAGLEEARTRLFEEKKVASAGFE